MGDGRLGRAAARRLLEDALRRSEADQTEVVLAYEQFELTRFTDDYVHQNVAARPRRSPHGRCPLGNTGPAHIPAPAVGSQPRDVCFSRSRGFLEPRPRAAAEQPGHG